MFIDECNLLLRGAVLYQQVRNRLGFVKFRFLQRRTTVEIFGVDVSAMGDQKLCDSALIAMRGGMQWSRPPMIIIVRRINVGAVFQQHLNQPLVSFPGGAVKRRRAISITRGY
ncbi:MAG TPA: hypothetical protein VN643_25345 [Pyrinomonadaceae bacterium]|nr:hypothetical protein [Pyrinomonadaceae bacterium]